MTFLKSGQANSAKSLNVKAKGWSLVFHFKSVVYVWSNSCGRQFTLCIQCGSVSLDMNRFLMTFYMNLAFVICTTHLRLRVF